MRILIVTDNPIILENILNMIHVALAESEVTAVDNYDNVIQAAQRRIDFTFLDMEMNDCNTSKLARQLQSMQPELNVICISGQDKYEVKVYKTDTRDYLLRPIKEKDLAQAVKDFQNACSEWSIKSPKIQAVCFGRFTVFYQGRQIKFRREKCKELFAYLIAKRGVGVSCEEICDALWPDDWNKVAYGKKIISELRITLRECGLDDILIRNLSDYALDVTRLECDYYDCLDGKIAWNGQFMEQYSWWAEEIKAELWWSLEKTVI